MFWKFFDKFISKKGNSFDNIRDAIRSDFTTHLWSDRSYNSFAQKAYAKNIIAFRAINIVATAASSIPIRLLKTIDTGEKIQIKKSPLLNLINHPSPLVSKSSFIGSIIRYILISGNCYILKIGQDSPSELHTLRPDRVEVLPAACCLPAGYRYRVDNITKDFPVDKITGKSQVLHIKSFHPFDDWYGLSPVDAANYSIDQHNQASAWNQAMLKNSARPSGALILKSDKNNGGTLSEEQYQNLRNQINDYYTGSAQTGRPILLEGGLEWKEMSLSPKDMDFIESKNNSSREIALAFGVPPQLLGIPGDNTYSNLMEARIAFWEETVIPMLDNILCNLNRWLIPDFGENIEISYDKDSIEALLRKREKIWQYIENCSFMTTDEKRQVFGLSPLNNESNASL